MKAAPPKGIWGRLARSRAVRGVAEELGGEAALEALLNRTGYPGKPEGLATRVLADLGRGLPLKLDPASLRAFGSLFDGPRVMAQARAEAALLPREGLPAATVPASQARLGGGEALARWPWFSGQAPARLARASALTGDPDLALAAGQGLTRVLAQHPPLMGPAWSRPDWLAARVLNWLLTLRFLERVLAGEPGLVCRLILHLEIMAHVLAQALADPGSQPDQAGPAGALLFLGQALPCLPEAEAWRELGRTRLGPALAAWARPGEAPTLAVAVAAEWGGLGLWLGMRAGLELPELVGGLRRLAWLCRAAAPPWSAGPGFGFDFTAPVFGPGGGEPFGGAANLAAVLLEEPELRAGRHPDERLFWLQGPEVAGTLRQLANSRPPQAGELRGAGLALLAFRAGERRATVMLGTSGDPATALALLVSLDGHPLLSPAGPATEGPLTAHLAGRAAQNAPLLDGTEPAAGELVVEDLRAGAAHAFASLSFAGYRSLPDPALLRRRVFWDPAGGILSVVDQVQAAGEHRLELHFHLPPGASAEPGPAGELWLLGEFGRVALRPDPRAQVTVVLGQAGPPLGWRAVAPGRVLPATVVVVAASLVGNASLSNLFVLTLA